MFDHYADEAESRSEWEMCTPLLLRLLRAHILNTGRNLSQVASREVPSQQCHFSTEDRASPSLRSGFHWLTSIFWPRSYRGRGLNTPAGSRHIKIGDHLQRISNVVIQVRN